MQKSFNKFKIFKFTIKKGFKYADNLRNRLKKGLLKVSNATKYTI